MIWFFIVTLIILCAFLSPYFLVRLKINRAVRNSFWWLIKYGENRLPFSTTGEYGMGQGLIYSPHPFTNWSLNPTYANHFGESVHTVEGFRKTQETNSIRQMLRENPDAYRIVCIGGSTTYCTEINKYQDTWPARLKGKLAQKDVLVFNFGVGGWGTIQSFVRCLTWLPIIRPQLLVFYQAKNDLTPLYNGTEKEKEIFPDYQNIMAQFSECFSLKLPKWLLYIPFFYLLEIMRFQNDLSYLYNRPKRWGDPRGLGRVNDEIIDGILFRTEALINMCGMLGCKVLYIPEIVRTGEYAVILDKIYNRIPEIINKYDHAIFFDIKGLIPDSEQYFSDKMHLNEKGCEIFAEILERQINKLL